MFQMSYFKVGLQKLFSTAFTFNIDWRSLGNSRFEVMENIFSCLL